MPTYQDRLFAFVDVLGWSELIKRSRDEPTLLDRLEVSALVMAGGSAKAAESNAIREMFHQADQTENRPPSGDLRFSHFSDTYVISGPSDSSAALSIYSLASTLAIELAELGHYVRGAVVCGELRHEADILYGPALIEAHQIEKSVAKYPRIVVTDAALKHLAVTGILAKLSQPTLLDLDGLTVLNVFQRLTGTEENRKRLDRLELDAKLRIIRDHGDLEHIAKHHWFIRHLAQVRAKEAA